MTLRSIRLAAMRAEVRTGEFNGKEYVVLPVVALIEGVLFASNSTSPELVLEEEFAKVPQGWNGRPVMLDHPSLAGERVSANEPALLERLQIGTVFHTAVKDKKLLMEAWIDPERVTAVGGEAEKVFGRIKDGGVVEVSVGVFVTPEDKSGEFNGARYADIWRDIIPDHLAFLPIGTEGACSVDMGCGAPRAAAAKEEKVADEKVKDLWARFLGLKGRFLVAEEVSDSDLRSKLDRVLFAEEAGYLGIEAVFPEASEVVYAVAPEGETVLRRRGFSLTEEGTVTLGGTVIEVKRETTFVPASAGSHGTSAAPSVEPVRKEVDMAKKERVAAIIASGKTCFTAADAEVLEGLSEERLASLEAHVATPTATPTPPEVKPKTAEELRAEFMAANPDVATIVEQHVAAAAARKTDLVEKLKAAQAVYTEEELKAKDTPELEKLLALSAVEKKKVDFSGAGLPKAAAGKDEVPKPPSMRDKILALRGGKAA